MHGAIIEHEVEIGKFSHMAPNAAVCGGVNVGENVFVGANAVIKEGVKLVITRLLGAGAIVLNNIPPNTTYVGNPAKKIK